jgi:hypothetical protein
LSTAALAATFSSDATAAVPPLLSASTIRAALQLASGPLVAGAVSASVVTLIRGALTSMFLTPGKIAGTTLAVLGLGVGVLAYQAAPLKQRKPAPAPTAAKPQPSQSAPPVTAALPEEPSKTYQSVLKHLDEKITMSFPNETPLEDVLKYIKSATAGPDDTGIPIYVDPAGLDEAKTTVTAPVTLDIEGAPLKQSLRTLLRPLGLDYRVQRNGLLAISSRRAILDGEIDELKDELQRVHAELADLRRSAGRPSAPDTTRSTPPPWQTSGPEDAKSKAVLKRLEEPISMSFANPTPLEDVLKYVKSATQGPSDTGIPIYVDPQALEDSEKTITSEVTIDLEGVPLRITLHLLLKQLGLDYKVENGVLTIVSAASEDNWPPMQMLQRAEKGEFSQEQLQRLVEQVKLLGELRKAIEDYQKGGGFP